MLQKKNKKFLNSKDVQNKEDLVEKFRENPVELIEESRSVNPDELKEDYSKLFYIFEETLLFVKKLLAEFEIISGSKKIIDKIPTAELIYIHIIIINLSKLFGKQTKYNKFTMHKFKSIFSQTDIGARIKKIEKTHKDIIEKIISNRNRIIAHTDENFHELHFSDDEIRKKKEDIKYIMRINGKEFKKNFFVMESATSKSEERYTVGDFKKDLEEIKKLLEKTEKILEEIKYLNYQTNSKKHLC